MKAKFIVRLLSEAQELLSWAEVWAEAKPQERGASCPFWSKGPTVFTIEQDGRASLVTVHWADLDVARQQALGEPVDVKTGQVVHFNWLEPVWLVPGMRDIPLPAVTVKQPVAIGVPVGSVTAVA